MHSLDTIPLIEITRGTITETIHRGAIAVVDTKGNFYMVKNYEKDTLDSEDHKKINNNC